MIDYNYLLKDTLAYKTLKNDKKGGTLSHAYLLINNDEKNLKQYLKEFAKIIMCKEEVPCNNCRDCLLINKEVHSDLLFLPKNDESVVTEDIVKLIEESYYKPIEGEKKVFVIYLAHTMNIHSQNKLLKTLEEPPKNVHIILGATSEYSLLPTIKSRVRKLEIPAFSPEKLLIALGEECEDKEKLERAVKLGDGTLGKAYALYNDENLYQTTSLVRDLLSNMKSSKDVLNYSAKIGELKSGLQEFLSVLEIYFRDLLALFNSKENLVVNKEVLTIGAMENGYNLNSVLNAIEKIEEANVRKSFNTNETMLVEWLLFQILEGKHKWQK